MKSLPYLASLLALAAVLCGCAGGATPPETFNGPAKPAVMEPKTSPVGPNVATLSGAGPLSDVAAADLAGRLGVPEETIEVLSIEAVRWPDASLGCPGPGTAYAQVVTPGYRILLEAEGRTYEYHTDRGRAVVLCGDAGTSREVSSNGSDSAAENRTSDQSIEGSDTDREQVAPVAPTHREDSRPMLIGPDDTPMDDQWQPCLRFCPQ